MAQRARTNRDRGASCDAAPPTPPDIRVRIRRFDGLGGQRPRDGAEVEGAEVDDWQGNGERGAIAEPPWAMWAAGGLRRQVPADAAASQLGKACMPALPLLPGDGAQPSSDPLVEPAQHRRGLADSEVTAPSDQIARHFPDDLFDKNLTGSIYSLVGPAVTRTFSFERSFLETADLMASTISETSASLPMPSSPHASDPLSGPI